MLNYETMLKYNIIDKKSFLINNYHLINISETELVIILIIQSLLDANELVTTKAIEEKMNISKVQIDSNIKRLVEKNYLSFDTYSTSNSIDTSLIYEKIIEKLNIDELKKEENNKVEEDYNLIGLFEKEFKRKMTPLEIETIREWSTTFNSELIVYAIKEAVMRGVLNLKYIEKIIVEQARLLNG